MDSNIFFFPLPLPSYATNTAQRNYSDNEFAQVLMPASGWLTVVLMDAPDAEDTLRLFQTAADHTNDVFTDMKAQTIGDYLDLLNEENVVEW